MYSTGPENFGGVFMVCGGLVINPYRTQISVSATAVSRIGVVRHEWGVLNTATAASSHREGSMVTGVAVQSQGPRNTHREVTNLPPAGQPRRACVWLCACICRQTAYYTYYLQPYTPTH